MCSYSQASSDGSGSAITVSTSRHGNWNYPGGTAYSPQHVVLVHRRRQLHGRRNRVRHEPRHRRRYVERTSVVKTSSVGQSITEIRNRDGIF
ncbi:MAG: hypothetical protein E6128_05655 [Cutibacterium avidum]|nr:hypothetical protein [Cutibacterium avidum]